MNPNCTPPGSYGLPLLGETLGWLRDPEAWVRGHLRRYGNIFRTSVFGRRVIVMIGPEANRFILLSHRDCFEWSGGYREFVGGLFPGSLSMEDGEAHDKHRRLLQPPFHGKALEGHLSMIQERVDVHTSNWARASEITAFDRLRTLTFDIITRALLGVVSPDELGRFGAAFESLSRGVLAPIKWDLPWSAYGRALRAKRRLEGSIGTAVEQERSNPRGHFLGSLLRDHAS